MKFDLEQFSFLMAILGIVVGATWKLSQQKTEILKLISADMNAINEALQDIRYSLGVHVAEYRHKDELTQFKISTIEESLKASFNRCQQQIKDIQGFLKKDTNYNIRDSGSIE